MVAERTINIKVPEELYTEINLGKSINDGNVDKSIGVSLAIGMFVSKEISLARAAELAKMTLHGFIDTLRNLDIPVVDYSESMLQDDIDFMRKYTERGL